MDFLKKIKYSFLSVVLAILFPIMALIVIFMAVLNYQHAYDAILEGFNKKLLSISSVSASFINGDDHRIIAIAKKMTSFSYSVKNNRLYAVDDKDTLNYINLEKGAAIKIDGFDLGTYKVEDISIDDKNDILYAVTKGKELIAIDLATKKITEIKKLSFDPQGVVYDADKKQFYISSYTRLYLVDKKKEKLLKEYENNLSSLNMEEKKLYGVDREANKVFSIGLDDLKYSYEELKDFPVESSALYLLAMDNNHFYAGEEHLMVYERNSSIVSESDFARLYRDETSAVYQRYIKPMTELKMALNLTYHYTFNLLYGDDENNCFYIMDVNEGNEYSPIGSYDDMDHDDLLGAENVMLRDSTYVGPIKLWEKWGLLKVAYAGIKDKKDHVVAVVGTDVDIRIINAKTKQALIQSIIIGIVALFIAILAAYYIAVKIIGPIQKLKYAALKIAAGKYGDKVFIKSPRELNILSEDFNQMSDELKNTIDNFSTYSTGIKDQRLKKELEKKLSRLSLVDDERIKVSGLKDSLKADGIIKFNDSFYVWSTPHKFDTLIDARSRRVLMADLLMHLLKAGEDTDLFKEMFDLDEFMRVNMDEGSVYDLRNLEKISSLSDEEQVITVGSIKITIAAKGNTK